MINDSKTNEIASTLLGKRVDGFSSYNPSVIVAVPREENRARYNIDSKELPFDGWDIWNCYEFSAMTKNNFPVTRVLKLRYSCNSDFIVESKSLKLYLNSFNMSCFGDSVEECLCLCKNLIENDLSEKLNTRVEVNFLNSEIKKESIFDNYINVMDLINESTLKITKFKESPELLRVEENNDTNEYYLKFDSLRSNCRVTHQPDFGDVFIYYKSKKKFDYNSLVEYLVSFRSEYHFHEECCEMIYKRLYDLLNTGDKLLVCALYTRRGGIDISPARYSKGLKFDDVDKLISLSSFARNGIKQ